MRATASLLLVLAVAAGEARAAAPKPTVLRVAGVPKVLVPGKAFRATVTVRRAGTVRLFLSKDAKKGRTDRVLTGRVVLKGTRRRATARFSVPPSVRAGRYRVLACAGPSCRAVPGAPVSVRPPPAPLGGAGAPPPPPSAPPEPAPGDPVLASPLDPGPMGPTPPAPVAGERPTGQVVFTARDCYDGPGRTEAVPEALVRFSKPFAPPIDVRLTADGRFTSPVPAGEDWSIALVLDGPEADLSPDTTPTAPYAIELGALRPGAHLYALGSAVGDATSGAAHAYATLQTAMNYAQDVAPVRLSRVHGRWRYAADLRTWLGDRGGSAYDESTKEVLIGGRIGGLRRDEHERFPLVHELGHHVLAEVANPGDVGGPHSYGSVHRDVPGRPWSEGFAHAFAAVAGGNGLQTLGCKPSVDLGATPPVARVGDDPALVVVPQAPDQWSTQVNEIAIGGALLRSVDVLGGRTTGMRRILAALDAFEATYGHAPREVREASDALQEHAAATTAEANALTFTAFRAARIGWAMGAGFKFGRFVNNVGQVQVSIRGPNSCPAPSLGGLPLMTGDDCQLDFVDPVFDDASSSGSEGAIFYPHLAGQAHRSAEWVISMVYRCRADDCPTETTGRIIGRAGLGDGISGFLRTSFDEDVTLVVGVSKDIMRFTADGACQLLTDNTDCGVL